MSMPFFETFEVIDENKLKFISKRQYDGDVEEALWKGVAFGAGSVIILAFTVYFSTYLFIG